VPEGHTVHRTANDFTKLFVGKKVTVDSPQGRFSSGANLVSGTTLTKAWAVGKQLFLEFDDSVFVRIHLGIYGKWQWHSVDSLPAVLGEVRARFYSGSTLAELRGPTVCEVIDDVELKNVLKRLGPDPLNSNRGGKESQRFIHKVLASKKTIGELLMDQSVIAGIGNVYRAELLFRANIEPHTPGHCLAEEQLLALWEDSVKLLKVGVKTSYMITRDELFNKQPSKADRNWVYKREGEPCRVCGTKVSIELMAGRKLYWCSRCQK
jgi:DNA-formamidopyrimidine glycosylase